MKPSTIGGINLLPEEEKRRIYYGLIPRELLEYFHLPKTETPQFESFTQFRFAPGSSDVAMSLFHELNFPDPILYGHLTDTMNGQIHVLLYILNDPAAPRFDVDKMPDGRVTQFGTLRRNIEAEQAALEAGLAPGQVRRGLRMLQAAVIGFENFVRRSRAPSVFRRAIVLSQCSDLRTLWFCLSTRKKVDGTYPSRILGDRQFEKKTGWLPVSFASCIQQYSSAFVGYS